MGGSFGIERRRGDRAPACTQSRQATDPRLDVAWMDRVVRGEPPRNARAVGAAGRRVDSAGLFRDPRIVFFRTWRGIGISRNRTNIVQRRRHDGSGTCRAYLRGESGHDKIFARGADVPADARGEPRADWNVPPRAPRRRLRELCRRRNSHCARNRRELFGAADTCDRSGLALVRHGENARAARTIRR